MKKSDIAMIVLIAAVSVLIAYFVASSLLGGKSTKTVTVKVAAPISAGVSDPDPTVFNKNAINPTVEVILGQGTSPQGSQ